MFWRTEWRRLTINRGSKRSFLRMLRYGTRFSCKPLFHDSGRLVVMRRD